MVLIAPPIVGSDVPSEANLIATSNVTTVSSEATGAIGSSVDGVETVATPRYSAMLNSVTMLWSVFGTAVLLIGGLGVFLWRGGTQLTEVPATTVATKSENQQAHVTQDLMVSMEPSRPQQEAAAAENLATMDRPISGVPNPLSLPQLPDDGDGVKIQSNGEDELGEGESTSGSVAEERLMPHPSVSVSQPAPVAEAKAPGAVLRFDPLDFDPAKLSLGRGVVTSSGPLIGSVPKDAEADSITEFETESTEREPFPSQPAATNPTLSVQLGPRSGRTGQATGMSQLAFRITSMSADKMQLRTFVDMVSEMAGVPITLDPRELELAGVSPAQTVSVQASNKTLENVLTDVLSKLRLELTEERGQLGVALAGGARQRSIDHDMRDLIDGEDAQPLVSLIQHFIAPNSWQGRGGNGSIVVESGKFRIEQLRRVHHEILAFSERLRMARGLPLRSRYPADRLSIEASYSLLADRLNRRTTFTFLPWTRLADVLQHWQETSGIIILVDWATLADADLGPGSLVACSAVDRTWEDVFDGILKSLGMAWWAVDGRTIQLTTTDALSEIRRIEFYAAQNAPDHSADAQVLRDALQTELQKSDPSIDWSSNHVVRFEFDEASGHLIVLAPPTTHRVLAKRLVIPAASD